MRGTALQTPRSVQKEGRRLPTAHGADHGEALFAAFISWDKPVPGYVLVLDDAQYQSNLLNQKTRSLV